jgi:hypothetical protein
MDKINLLIFITPKIIRQYEGIRPLLDKKLKERDDFIQNNLGGEDLNREKRDQIVRELPNISTFKQRPLSTETIESKPIEPNAEPSTAEPIAEPTTP